MENKEVYCNLNNIVKKLKSTNDPKRKYEYILWLGKKLPTADNEILIPENKVRGCVSEVYVKGSLKQNKIYWQGFSDALITRGLLSFLICGLNELSPQEILNLNNNFIEVTGLKKSLTPSRSNGFLNILIKMKSQANEFLNSQ